MPDFTTLLMFSHTYCVAICAVLVPINIIATSLTLGLVGLNSSASWVWRSAVVASLCALVMVLHVLTWFVVGVIAVQTFILFSLGGVCLSVNLWAVFYPEPLRGVLFWLRRSLRRVLTPSLSVRLPL